MKPTVEISCKLSTTDSLAPLGLEIWIDHQMVFDQTHVAETTTFNHAMIDDEAEHELRFVLKNKTAEHTVVDESGNFIKDACLIISDLSFDGIQLGHTLTEFATYEHNFNGTNNNIQAKFFGTMGCNGTVSFKFTTPFYLWLLEHM
jgi:hypothetical protein